VTGMGTTWQCSAGLLRLIAWGLAVSGIVCGCRTPLAHRRAADRTAEAILGEARDLAGQTPEQFRIDSPADTLRRRLLLDQHLPYHAEASLGTRDLPDSDMWRQGRHLLPSGAAEPGTPDAAGTLRMSLAEAIQICARNSREYQSAKETLFRTALDLDLAREEFRSTFTGLLSGLFESTDFDGARQNGLLGTVDAGVGRNLRNGAELTTAVALDLAKLLTQDRSSSLGIVADASITIPLLRGAGRRIVTEPLTQAERNMLYAVYDFERFKRAFTVSVASDYFGVIRERQQTQNQEENYRRRIASARRARRLADAGRMPEFQFDQAVQNELGAREGWIRARQAHARRLDAFKKRIGLPPDANVELVGAELTVLRRRAERLTSGGRVADYSGSVPPADAPIELREPSAEEAGPFELTPARAVQLALDNRLDLRRVLGGVADAQRGVYVAADGLRPELTLFGSGSAGESRSVSQAGERNAVLEPAEGSYSALLRLDLALERTAERNGYRDSLIQLEEAVRSFQEAEDQIKLDVRGRLRELLQARESVQIQTQATELAARRVTSTDLLLQAGRAQIRDVLEAQEALLQAQNAQNSALIAYRVAELELQRDLGLLQVGVDGVWQEYLPTEDN